MAYDAARYVLYTAMTKVMSKIHLKIKIVMSNLKLKIKSLPRMGFEPAPSQSTVRRSDHYATEADSICLNVMFFLQKCRHTREIYSHFLKFIFFYLLNYYKFWNKTHFTILIMDENYLASVSIFWSKIMYIVALIKERAH
uniref:Uncharacterized protein n=1 Tax=Cacopsylla melanoneura TaxID=428564 RepID=A0A8D8QN36_9HEMI